MTDLKSREAAAYNQWLAAEVQASIDDLLPSIPHDEVMHLNAKESFDFFQCLIHTRTIQ